MWSRWSATPSSWRRAAAVTCPRTRSVGGRREVGSAARRHLDAALGPAVRRPDDRAGIGALPARGARRGASGSAALRWWSPSSALLANVLSIVARGSGRRPAAAGQHVRVHLGDLCRRSALLADRAGQDRCPDDGHVRHAAGGRSCCSWPAPCCTCRPRRWCRRLNSYWKWIHVTTVALSSSVLMVSGAASVLYLLRGRLRPPGERRSDCPGEGTAGTGSAPGRTRRPATVRRRTGVRPVAARPAAVRRRRWTGSPTGPPSSRSRCTRSRSSPARCGPRWPGAGTGAGIPRRPARSSPG